jgi:hypothetical protein
MNVEDRVNPIKERYVFCTVFTRHGGKEVRHRGLSQRPSMLLALGTSLMITEPLQRNLRKAEAN